LTRFRPAGATATACHDDSLVYVGTGTNVAGSPARALVAPRSSSPTAAVVSAWGFGISNTLTAYKHPEPDWGVDELAGYSAAHATSASCRAPDFK
jgi:hypothetical protein